ncbi:MAG: hypothetical protein NVS9B15_24470 [Acidobacteriaceae bacterium]
MTVKASYCTPMLHVASIEDSIRFYQHLGFELIDTEGSDPIGWARIHSKGGGMMFLRAEHPIDKTAQAVMFTLYTSQLPALREQLLAAGINASAIRYPEYMPSGEISLKDPDGFLINICQWGEPEQTAWEKRVGDKADLI